ncbi:prepilin-type N-terminal cleavage/methylation domain-containing protein [Jeotgalibaca sp. MA1X17-3]|uniref:PilW family protein n=1 Tax=Jeotgalibaca sp. MA1X17-3 TaxID=2908211 RepID=UPI001F48B5A1|nr:prepilin-type N-terminal cleavage/methylation domain-containing protein [Jeotgalibaca sp. MA1X17-3]UJF14840.1 prepilin-type N-terminal cleavage/methylation domain-containing protein [Jeotgalibaca sp. MA1X17-3]
MRKWKHVSHSPKTLLKNSLVNEEGMTLIELLASIAILSVVILLVGSVHMFGQKQYINESYSAKQSNDLTYSLSVLSREVRKAGPDSVTVDKSVLIIDGIEFKLDNSQLKKNGQVLADNIESFDVEEIEDNEGIKISVTSKPNQNGKSKEYSTAIYFRR